MLKPKKIDLTSSFSMIILAEGDIEAFKDIKPTDIWVDPRAVIMTMMQVSLTAIMIYGLTCHSKIDTHNKG